MQARGQLRREGAGRGASLPLTGLGSQTGGRAGRGAPPGSLLGELMWVLVAGRLERPPREDAAGERGRDR